MLSVVTGIVMIPAQPASAHHVCVASAKTPGFIDQKLGLIYGESRVTCSSKMTALYIDSYLLFWSNRANQWVTVSEGHDSDTETKETWTDAYYDCTGQILTMMTRGTSFGIGFGGWNDRDEDARSGYREFVCGSSGGIPLINP